MTAAAIAKKVVVAATNKINNNNKKKTVDEQIQDLKNNADSMLAELDRAAVFRRETPKDFPSFDHAEIDTGPLLGKGGFSDVFEVSTIMVTRRPDDHDNNNDDDDDDDNAIAAVTEALATTDDDTDAAAAILGEEEEIIQKFRNGGDADDDHYEFQTARFHMSTRCLRFGSARYAIKRLRQDLSNLDRERGMLDLAIEIRFFSVLWHPNIVKMRAISSGPRLSPDTFLLMDRLYGTLDDKIEGWHQVQQTHQGCCGGFFGGNNKPALKELMMERLLVAYDLSAAINYVHGHR